MHIILITGVKRGLKLGENGQSVGQPLINKCIISFVCANFDD
jgi:hypothetical protein